MTPPGMILNLAVVLSSAVHFDLMFSAVLGSVKCEVSLYSNSDTGVFF